MAVPLAAAAMIASIAGCGGDRPARVTVYPIPGSLVAPTQAQIVFRGVPVRKLGSIVVTGSRSGVHHGRLLPDSDKRGGSFLPDRPFTAGERVTVRTRPHLLRHGRSFSFTVATPAGPLPQLPRAPAYRVPGDLLSFHSRPDLVPPSVEITKRSSRSAPGDIFIGPEHGPVQSGPMILDSSGQLVWFHPLPDQEVPADFRVQTYHGQPVLTWWQGHLGAGVGVGEDVIDDSSYRQLAVVHAADGLSADLHEFLLEPGDRALLTAYYPVYWDASSVHGSQHAIVLDSVVQEIDIKTGLLLFEWDSLDHVPLTDSYEPLPADPGHPYDYFHVNSIQRDQDGDLVISARNTWAAYKIVPSSGRIAWTLGGKRSTFKLPPQASFAFQHHVRLRGANNLIVTVFDDGAGPPTVHAQSRGLTLKLHPKHRTVTLMQVDNHAPSLLTQYEGDLQQLPDSDQFLGWGQQPYFTEFDSHGQMVFDGRFLGGNSSYRAYRFKWSATPHTLPAVIASRTGSSTDVYASWNGATDVASWQILSGATPSSLHPAGSARRQGFETRVTIPAAPYVAARALDAHGHTLATSSIVRSR